MAVNELATASVQLVWEKDPATFWTLVPSADNVSRRADGSVSPSVVSVDVVKTTGSEQERVKYGILRFSRNDYALEEELPVSASGTSNGVNIGSSSSVTFRLYDTDGRTLLANRRIPVVDDGQPGQPGADSVTWTLVPSVTAVKYDTMTGAYSPVTLSCRLMRHDGDAVSEIDNPSGHGLAMWFCVDSNRAQYVPGMSMQLVYPVRPSRFAFSVTKGTAEVARADIPVVTNGPYVPFPRLWDEYPDDYVFMQGKDGEERRDLVLARDDNSGRLYACACKLTHVKNTAYPPLPTGGPGKDHWVTGEQQKFIATELLLAKLAYVRNLMAEYVQMYDAEGNILFEVYNGNVVARTGTFENVRVSGSVSAGDPHGKRVLLDPDGKAVRIYDADGSECARLDGSSYTYESVMPAAGQTLPAPDGKAVSMSAAASPTTAATDTRVVMARSASTATGIGSVRITVSADVSMPPDASPRAAGSEMTPVVLKTAYVYCTVATYDVKGTLLDSSRLLVAACAMNADGSYSGSATRTYTVAVPEGRHEISFELQATGDSASATVKLTQATFVADAMMTRYFGNGFALTKDTENYLIALYDSTAKRMRLLLGGILEVNGVRQPATVYAGRVTDGSTSASVGATLTSRFYPGTSAGVTLTKGSTPAAGYTLRFPASYGLTPANSLIRLTGYGGVADKPTECPAKPSLKSVAASGSNLLVTVWVSDDASPNYGGFDIEVCRTG